MTPAIAEALGRRWIAAGGGWREGMLSLDGWRVLAVYGVCVCASDGGAEGAEGVELRECSAALLDCPDLRDPATRGAALEVVRERWNSPALQISPVVRTDMNGASTGGITGWRWYSNDKEDNMGTAFTEGACLVAALESAPKVSP